jgi:hypothetical protein
MSRNAMEVVDHCGDRPQLVEQEVPVAAKERHHSERASRSGVVDDDLWG